MKWGLKLVYSGPETCFFTPISFIIGPETCFFTRHFRCSAFGARPSVLGLRCSAFGARTQNTSQIAMFGTILKKRGVLLNSVVDWPARRMVMNEKSVDAPLTVYVVAYPAGADVTLLENL